MGWARCVITVVITCAALSGQAHEVRPAYLKLSEVSPNTFHTVWKQPTLGSQRLPIDPVLPGACTRTANSLPEVSNGALLHRWITHCALRAGHISIRGLEQTLTDVMVQLDYLNGDQTSALLRGADPRLDLADPTPAVWSYLALGVEHLLLGIDHILFVAGLVLFISGKWSLLKTITAFTLAHSITLGLSVLSIVTLPQGPVEAVIALSILFLARELALPQARRSAVTRRKPWLMAFAFGLLHGFGFAGALAEIGLPRDQLAPALLLFNVGIEIGQLLVVALLLAAGWLLRHVDILACAWQKWGSLSFSSAVGVAAAFWTIDRMVLAF